MFRYKILPCPRRHSHDWTSCPYAHSGESARRRDPSVYRPIPCPESKTGRPCPRGESCKYAHNDFEYWLHPTRYCTEYCKQGPGCKRRVCFFAHKPSELRKPADIINTLNAHGWLANPGDDGGLHDRRCSLSSMDSSETFVGPGFCLQPRSSIGSIESWTAQEASQGSCGSDVSFMSSAPTLASGRSPRLRQARCGGVADASITARSFPQEGAPCSARMTDADACFATGVHPSRQAVLDEVKNALAGCCADPSILDSVDPSIFLAGSADLSPKSDRSGSDRSYGSKQTRAKEQDKNEDLASLEVLMNELKKRRNDELEAELSNAACLGVNQGGLYGNGRVPAGVPSPRRKTIDEMLTQSLATPGGPGQGSFDSSRSGSVANGAGAKPFVMDSLMQIARNPCAGRGHNRLGHASGVTHVGQYSVPKMGQTDGGFDCVTATNEIMASLEMNLEYLRREGNDLNSVLGAMQFGGYSAANYAPTSPVNPTLPQVSWPNSHAIPGGRCFLDATQLNATNWEHARSLSYASGLSGHNREFLSPGALGLEIRSQPTSAQGPLQGSRFSLGCGAYDGLVFGIPEGLPLCG